MIVEPNIQKKKFSIQIENLAIDKILRALFEVLTIVGIFTLITSKSREKEESDYT